MSSIPPTLNTRTFSIMNARNWQNTPEELQKQRLYRELRSLMSKPSTYQNIQHLYEALSEWLEHNPQDNHQADDSEQPTGDCEQILDMKNFDRIDYVQWAVQRGKILDSEPEQPDLVGWWGMYHGYLWECAGESSKEQLEELRHQEKYPFIHI